MSISSALATPTSAEFSNQLMSSKVTLPAPDRSLRPTVHEKRARCAAASLMRMSLSGLLALTIWLCAGSLAKAQSVWTTSPVPVGTTSSTVQTISVTVTVPGTLNSAPVLTMGSPGLDFAASGTVSCSGALTAGTVCRQQVTFTPKAPGLRTGAVQLLDINGKVLGYTLISGTGKGGLGVLLSGNMKIVAGDGTISQPVADPEPALTATLFHPSSVVLDGAGNLYISDAYHYRIRKVTFSGGVGTISTIAGTGVQGFSGDRGPATSAQLDIPNGLALDGAGNLFVADAGNHAIRMISAATSSTPGNITTVAGILHQQSTTGTIGDGQQATAATLNTPQGIAVDATGNLWIADTDNNEVREVTTNGIIHLMAGDPAGAQGTTDTGSAGSVKLYNPWAVAVDSSGNWYIADTLNGSVLKVVGSTVSALAQNLTAPSGLAIDAAGNIYFTVFAGASDSEIGKVNASGVISTVAQNLAAPVNSTVPSLYAADKLYGPVGITLDGSGDIFFADWGNMVVKEILNQAFLDFTSTAVRQGQVSSTLLRTLENDGNAALNLTGYTFPTSTSNPVVATGIPPLNVQVNAGSSTTCSSSVPIATDKTCVIGVNFAPGSLPQLQASTTLISDVDIANSGAVSPLVITTYGLAAKLSSTSTILSSSPTGTAAYGTKVTLTAGVSTGAGTGQIGGTVVFTDTYNGVATILAPVAGVTVGSIVNNNTVDTATAALTISTLQVGQHSIVACYSPSASDGVHSSSCTTDNGGIPLTLTVYQGTTIALTSSANPALVGSTVTFTATVSATNGLGVSQMTGTVDFFLGGTTPICSSQPLSQTAPWTATCSTATLPQGNGSKITASYSGDTTEPIYGSTTTTALTQDMRTASSATLLSSLNPSTYGSPVKFTFTVAGTFTSSETATFSYGSSTPVSVTSSNGTWTWTTSALPVASPTALTISASYPGDTNYAPVTASVSQQVYPADTTPVLIAPATGIAGLPIALTATVSATTGTGIPTGTVTFMDGTTTLGTATLAGGKATLSPSPTLPVGVNSLTAVYGGDGNDSTSTSAAVPVTISLGSTLIAFVNPPTTAEVETPVSFTVQVSSNGVTPTGSVVFLDGTTPIGTVALAGGSATLPYTFTTTSATTPHSITATYLGDTNNAPPTVGITPDAITVTAIPTQTTLQQATTGGTNASLILIASVVGVDLPTQFPPTGTVVFTNGTTTLGSAQILDGVATFQPSTTGQLNVIATYSPTLSPVDALHSGSASAALAVTNNANGFTLTATPPKLTISPTQNASVTVTITPVNGFKDTVGLGCGSLPPGMTCTFSSLTTALDGTKANTITLTIDTNNPLLGGATAMNTPRGNARLTLASFFWPLGLLSGVLLWRFRKRSNLLRNALLVLLFAGSSVLMNGCGGIGKSSAVPGTYTIQVIGVGINSNISQYATLTVTVTK